MTHPVQTHAAGPVRLPHHPRATAALALAIVSVVGAIVVLPAALGPVVVYMAASARREIDRDPARWGGRRQATVALVLGTVSSVLLLLLTVTLGVSALGLVFLSRFDGGY